MAERMDAIDRKTWPNYTGELPAWTCSIEEQAAAAKKTMRLLPVHCHCDETQPRALLADTAGSHPTDSSCPIIGLFDAEHGSKCKKEVDNSRR